MSGLKWTKDDKMYLKENYRGKTANFLSNRLNRSKEAVYNKANAMGLSSNVMGSGSRWMEEEIDVLKKEYPKRNTSEIAKKLDRTTSSVRNKAEDLGLRKKKKLTDSEKDRIRNLYREGVDISEISKETDVPVSLIREFLLSKEKIEELYLVEELSQKEIAERVGTTQSYISEKMKEYGIKTESHKPWSEEEEEILRENYLEIPKPELLSLLPDRGWEAIKLKAFKLGLAQSAEEYRKSDEVRERLNSFAKKNEIQVNFKKKGKLSYVMGVIDGDGFHDKENAIGLEVKSEKFADKFYKALKDLNLNPGRGNRKNRDRETVWGSSKQLVEWCESMDIKEKINWLKKEGDEWKYIEGRYESDGSLRPGGSPCICSTDGKELDFLHNLLTGLDINCSKQKQMVYVLKSSRDEFYKNIDPVIRKNSNGE